MSTSLVPNTTLTASSQAVVNYLTSDSEQIRCDAFKHLVAILITATKRLYIPETDNMAARGTSAKYDYAVEFLLTELHPYTGMPAEMVREAAREDKFRYLGRKFRQRVLNKIRDFARSRRQARFQTYIDSVDYRSCELSPPSLTTEQLEAMLAECDFLSDRQIQTVWGLWRARNLRKGDQIRTIASERNVSLQQARKDRKHVNKAFLTALKSGHSGAMELFECLSKYIRCAVSMPRDEDFGDRKNLGTSIHPIGKGGEPIQFESFFGYHRDQDMKILEREYNHADLAEYGRG